ncbi:AMP-binding protein [Jongsikchunia kroppenstedtii]|uniref:AMP-binding protein n=1 Tax=Jongsikchunia kroppenstedtii TaxID=1121721 RepID=UPI0006849231|nr:AMP-binding protein [Jongsikchunia kroppenstedtii]
MAVADRLASARSALAQERHAARILREAGMIPGLRDTALLLRHCGRSGPAGLAATLGAQHGDTPAIIDAHGTLTYRQFGHATNALTNALADRVGGGRPTIAVMVRNSRYTPMAFLASAGIGAKVVLMNTDMGPRQLADVCAREQVGLIIYDDEFTGSLAQLDYSVDRLVAWVDGDAPEDAQTVDAVIRAGSPRAPRFTRRMPDMVILTSGSSGTPKGRSNHGRLKGAASPSLATLAGFFQKIPLRGTDRILLNAPAFHGWGAIVMFSGLLLGSTFVMDRRFDAERSVALAAEHRVTAIIGVPTTLRRLMDLGPERLAAIDHRAIRIIGSGGARLDVPLVERIMTEFGPVLHNLYGATEASFITIATPEDLVAHPETAGSAPIGVSVRILRDGAPVPVGEVGDIYVRSAMVTGTYTNGETKESIDGAMKTGDTGRLDAAGRLFIEGRSDGMIVSGGENVFPEEVELVLANHPAVADVKVAPVDDPEFGQRLRAFVVPRDGATIGLDEIKTYVSNELSRSRMPREVIVVPELPRTATGKVTNATLAELARAYQPIG